MSNRLSVIFDRTPVVILLFFGVEYVQLYVLANSMHPAIVLAPPLHPPRPHPASSMPCVLSQR